MNSCHSILCVGFGVYVQNSNKYLGKFVGEIEGVHRHRQQLIVCSAHSVSDSDVFTPLLVDKEADTSTLGFPCDVSVSVKPHWHTKTAKSKSVSRSVGVSQISVKAMMHASLNLSR